MDRTDLEDALSDLGLDRTERAVYVSLLDAGEATASDVADAADVSTRHVYDIAGELAERGFLEVDRDASPTTFRPKSPDELYEHRLRTLESARLAIRQYRGDATDALAESTVTRDDDGVIRDVETLLSASSRHVALSLPARAFGTVADDLRAAVDRGVGVTLLLWGTETELDALTVEDLSGAAAVVRVTAGWLPTVVSADGEAGLVYPHYGVTGQSVENDGLLFEDGDLDVLTARFFHDVLWIVGEEVYTADPDPLPATFDSIRNAIVAAELHRQRGTGLRARVEVETGDGEAETREGPVTDVRQRLVYPETNTSPGEDVLVVATAGGTVEVTPQGTSGDGREVLAVTLERDE